MAKSKYKHFNPKEHKIESKIATVKTGHHCKCRKPESLEVTADSSQG